MMEQVLLFFRRVAKLLCFLMRFCTIGAFAFCNRKHILFVVSGLMIAIQHCKQPQPVLFDRDVTLYIWAMPCIAWNKDNLPQVPVSSIIDRKEIFDCAVARLRIIGLCFLTVPPED